MNKTPYYLFDKELFVSMVQEYKSYGDLFFPIKANDDSLVISALIENDCSFEVDSIEHMRMLIEEYNVSPERILYSYLIREIDDIRAAIEMGITYFVIDSVEEFNKVISISKDVSFYIRINVLHILDNNLPPEKNKWGLSVTDAKKLMFKIKEQAAGVSGISFYIASEINRKNSFEIILASLVSDFSGLSIKSLDIGGGVSLDTLKKIHPIIKDFQKCFSTKQLIIEPGRHLLNPCIDMVVTVMSIKYINGNRLIFINAGIYNGLIDAIVKEKKYSIIDQKQTNSSKLCQSYICGSSSDVSDTLGYYELREDLTVGDLLYIKDCGAYSSVMKTRFYNKSKIPLLLKDSYVS